MTTTIIPHGGRLMTILDETYPKAGKRQAVFSRLLVQITADGQVRVLRGSLIWSKFDVRRFLENRGVL